MACLQRGLSVESSHNEPTLFLVDDEEAVRSSLARLLRAEGFTVATYASAEAFLDDAPFDRLGCILLDVDMPGMTGPALQEALAEKGADLPVIFLTGRGSVSLGVRAMKLGAVDFLEKPIDADVLVPVLREAIQRHRTAREQGARARDIQQRLDSLSAREREVLEHVVRGRLNKQIAGDLGIAVKTVKVHRGRVMAKMRVRSVAELVRLWEEMDAPAASSDRTTQ